MSPFSLIAPIILCNVPWSPSYRTCLSRSSNIFSVTPLSFYFLHLHIFCLYIFSCYSFFSSVFHLISLFKPIFTIYLSLIMALIPSTIRSFIALIIHLELITFWIVYPFYTSYTLICRFNYK